MGTIGTHADAKRLRRCDAHGVVESIGTANAVPRDHELSQVVAWHLEVLLLCLSFWCLATLHAGRIEARPSCEVRLSDENGKVSASVSAEPHHQRRMSFAGCDRHEDRQAVRDPGAEDEVVYGASDLPRARYT